MNEKNKIIYINFNMYSYINYDDQYQYNDYEDYGDVEKVFESFACINNKYIIKSIL